jgi:hypothetical protein
MAYLYSTGSRGMGDIEFEGDPDETQIDFEDDFIALKTGGNRVLVVSGSTVGIGTILPDPDELLTIDGVGGDHEANIQFREDGANRAKIGVNDSDNLVFHNQTVNKHIVFKVNDQGVTREGMRVDGATAAVVVNEGSDSLIDFRVESNNSTHMLFVDGSNNTVGVGTSTPGSALHVNASFATAITGKTSDYTLAGGDHTILVDCSSGNVTLTLPTAVGCSGRMYIIKRIDNSANAANINSNGSEEIDGSTDSASVPGQSSIVLQSDNSGWWKVAEYIKVP